MTNPSTNGLTSEQELLITALESLPFSVDSQVSLAHRGSDLTHVLLQEVYRTGPDLPLVFTPLFEWSPGQLLPPKLHRDDYGGISINAATVASINRFVYSSNLLLKIHSVVVQYIPYTPQGFLTCCKILQHGANSFTSPLKEVMLWIFTALENLSSSAEIEPTNPVSNGKHSNH
jgi:hypothetical protein